MINLLKYLFLLILLNTTLSSKSLDKRSLALEMLNTMNKNGYVQKMMDGEIYQRVSQNPLLAANSKKVIRVLKKHLSFNKLKPKLAAYYAKELSTNEIRAFTKFCATKEGQKILLKFPKLINIGSKLAEIELQKHYKELISEVMK